MTTREFDVIVLGLGGIGAAVCDHLARRGKRVLGLERFDFPHNMGSSHGASRVIRLAYFEDPCYVPLVRRALAGWRDLESRCHERLIVTTGGLDIGPPDSPELAGVVRGLTGQNIPFERIDAAEVRRRYPVIQPPHDHIAIHQGDSGFVIPERCTVAHIESAIAADAECRAREAVQSWSVTGGRVFVSTIRGEYAARHLVVCAGAWLPRFVPEFAKHLTIERQVQAWFHPRDAQAFAVGAFPVMIHHTPAGAYYAIPHHGRPGVKVCRHHGGATVNPDTLDRDPTPADEDDIRAYMRQHLPAADGPVMAMNVCMYTNTPDGHFIVDRHPHHDEILIAGGFSGHGYKFAPVIGEVIADLITRGHTDQPIAPFKFARFS